MIQRHWVKPMVFTQIHRLLKDKLKLSKMIYSIDKESNESSGFNRLVVFLINCLNR